MDRRDREEGSGLLRIHITKMVTYTFIESREIKIKALTRAVGACESRGRPL